MDEIKEFLLEEYKALTETLQINEETGERRLTFFYTVCVAVLGAVIVFLAKMGPFDRLTGEINNKPKHDLNIVEVVILIFLFGLFVIGLIVRRRLKARNQRTDGYIKDLQGIRQIFKEQTHSFTKLPGNYTAFKPRGTAPRERKFTSLADIASVMNILILVTTVTIALFFYTGSLQYSSVFGGLALVAGTMLFYGKAVLPRIKMKKSSHAGGVVFRRTANGKPEYLLVKAKDKGQWVLPKGHIEKDEVPQYTALREVLEETGCPARIIKRIGTIAFSVNENMVRSDFFLMEIDNQFEDREKKWVTVAEAVKLLHPESGNLLKKAETEILQNHTF